MIGPAAFSLLIGCPVLLSLAALMIARRSGEGLGWQVIGASGAVVALPCLALPADQWLASRARQAGAFALGLGTAIPALVLLILSFRRRPVLPGAQRPSETSQ